MGFGKKLSWGVDRGRGTGAGLSRALGDGAKRMTRGVVEVMRGVCKACCTMVIELEA
jgi:hypothetical protein